MLVQLIVADNDSGHAASRMGQGPSHILAGNVEGRLTAAGHQVETIHVGLSLAYPTEIAAAFHTVTAVARQVRMARRQRRFPVILAGNCIASVGAVAGDPGGGTAVLWMDAHADFHTPDTTRSGFLDGMAVSVVAGDCWRTLAATIPGFRPVAPEGILLLGTRDVEKAERQRLRERGAGWLDLEALREDPDSLPPALLVLSRAAGAAHLHVDLDVLDPGVTAAANAFAPAGGLTLAELSSLLAVVTSRCRLASLTLASYDPSGDPRHVIRDAAVTILELVCSSVPGQRG